MGKQTLLPGKNNALDDDEFEDVTFEEEDQTEFDEMVGALESEMNDRTEKTNILIKRVIGQGQADLEHCGSYPPDLYSWGELIEQIRKDWGPGTYRVYLRKNNKNSKNKVVRIAAKLTGDETANQSSGNDKLVTKMLEEMQRLQNQVLKLASASTNQQGSRQQYLEEIKTIAEIFNGRQPTATDGALSGLAQLKETMGVMKALGYKVGGDVEPEETNLLSVLDRSIPLLQQLVEQRGNQLPQPAQTAQPQTQQKAPPSDNSFTAWLEKLLKGAHRGTDPIVYAEIILDQWGEPTVENFLRANMHAHFLSDPRVQTHKQWFVDVIEHLKAFVGLDSKFADQYKDLDDGLNNNDSPDINGKTMTTESNEAVLSASQHTGRESGNPRDLAEDGRLGEELQDSASD